jgi:hypothetical protein
MVQIHALYSSAVRTSERQLKQAQARREQLSFLATSAQGGTLQSLADLPTQLTAMSTALSGMPIEDSIREAANWERRVAEREMRASYGRQEWEERAGYESWALERAVASAGAEAVDGTERAESEDRDVRRIEQERKGTVTSALALADAMSI